MTLSARKADRAAVFDHYLSLGGRQAPGAEFTSRLMEFTQRTTGRLGGGTEAGGGSAASITAQLVQLDTWALRNARRVLVVVAETDLFDADEVAIVDSLRPYANVDVILSRTKVTYGSVGPGRAAFDQAEWSVGEQMEFVKGYLGRFNKRMDDEDVERLACHPLSVDLSFPRLVCDHLVNWSTFGTLSRELDLYVSARDFKGVAELMLAQAQANLGRQAWLSFARAMFDRRELGTEMELMMRAGSSPAAFSIAMAIVAPLVERWAGRVWIHRGRNWSSVEQVLQRSVE